MVRFVSVELNKYSENVSIYRKEWKGNINLEIDKLT